MKNYFDFTLSGKRFFPFWIVYYLLFMLPYFTCSSIASRMHSGEIRPWPFLVMILSFFIGLFWSFYLIKLTWDNVKYKDVNVRFSGSPGILFCKNIGGLLLSMITLLFYYPWYIKNITKYITEKTSLNSESFKFNGKGGKLLVIFLLALLLPVFVLFFVLRDNLVYILSYSIFILLFFRCLFLIIIIPYIYYAYKWMVDFEYKDYIIKWKTSFWDSCSLILIQVVLSFVTLGIYSPVAVLRVYKYFSERTFARNDEKTLHFGYEIEPWKDFLFIWGQLLLAIITLGIYFPWAYSKIGKRVLGKTYSIEVVE